MFCSLNNLTEIRHLFCEGLCVALTSALIVDSRAYLVCFHGIEGKTDLKSTKSLSGALKAMMKTLGDDILGGKKTQEEPSAAKPCEGRRRKN